MDFLFSILTGNDPYLTIPTSSWDRVIVVIGLVVYGGVIGIILRQWWTYNKPIKGRRVLLAVCLLLVPVSGLFIGVRFPAQGALPPPLTPVEPAGPVMMIFAALPWMLSAGFFGPLVAVITGAFAGLARAYWDTRSIFTVFEFALLALLFAVAVNQRYRTRFYEWLRHPIVPAIFLIAIHPVIGALSTALITKGSLAIRLDYALANLPSTTLAMVFELGFAGLVAEIISRGFPSVWGRRGIPLQPSPAEKSIQTRFIYRVAPLALVLASLLMVGDWVVAERVARQILSERLADTARIAAEGVPYFLGAGQNLIKQLAEDEQFATGIPDDVQAILEDDLRRVPFFSELYVLNQVEDVVAGYPFSDLSPISTSVEEQMGIQIALTAGIPVQDYTIPPTPAGTTARVSFIAAIPDAADNVIGVLIGRADLQTNPFSQPIIDSLKIAADQDGEGLLLDEEGHILYHPDAGMIMQNYPGEIPQEDFGLVQNTAPDGTRQYTLARPAVGRAWAVVLTVPAQRVQQWAINIAAPLLGMIILLGVVGGLLLRFGLKFVTRNLENLAVQAGNIARGNLEISVAESGEDEVGQLRHAFEQMRLSLKARLEELNQLLLVSQGVASSLEMLSASKPILESAMKFGAVAARIVLDPKLIPDLEGNSPALVAYGAGVASESYTYLDGQILDLNRGQERLVLSNISRPRLLQFAPGAARPEGIIAIALRHENRYYGSLWAAYDKPHRFTDEEVRFIATLGGQAALAAANAHLFLSAEIGRQRLAAILASTPDPVLVTDQEDRLLLANPAAWRVLGLGADWEEGQPVDKIINQGDLLNVLDINAEDKQSVEVTMPNGRVYYAMASTVLAEGQRVGRICVLRDITTFKELDSLKSEFVATVSHDLRSPLTLMRGYATMLEMVGDLNEQQQNYVRKIVGSVETMTRLVNNLLDLGRIESGIELQSEMLPVRDLVDRVVGALQLQATQKKVTLKANVPGEAPPLVEADGALLQQAIYNLVDNAIKYTDPGGRVEVSVDGRENSIIFEVRDTGIGIAPVDQPHLFEKFYRVERRGDIKRGGTGLGLAIVKSIADRHGGRVWVESQLGKGSKFYFAIPVRQAVVSK